jgi:glycosyltransferase involved in cell wall biosynthesis
MARRIAIVANGLTHGGVTRFIRNIVLTISRYPNEFTVYFLTDSAFPAFDNITLLRSVDCPDWPTPRLLVEGDLDCIVYPKSTIPAEHFGLPAQKTVLIHDLIGFEDSIPEYDDEYIREFRLTFPRSLAVADRVVAMSHFTRGDLLSRFPELRRDVFVCGGGVDAAFLSPSTECDEFEFQPVKPYFLYVGSLSPRKNMLNTLRAFKRLENTLPHMFYICSAETWNDEAVTKYIREHLSGRVVTLGRVSDSLLAHLFRHAETFVYASLYEGFGFPILEAQSSGCPVLTSDRTSCPEVAGDGALTVNPEDEEQIAAAMLQLSRSASLRLKLVASGYSNIKRYSWENAARLLLA